MGTLSPQASVSDVINEFAASAQGTGPWSLMNNAGITSGQVYAKITEANATLQGWTGVGTTTTDPLAVEQIKRYEANYAAALLAMDMAGLTATDGFNVTAAGLAVQRVTAQTQTYMAFIKNHLANAQFYLKMLHPWFFVYGPQQPQGFDEYNNPVTYWNVSQARDYGG